MTLKACIQLLVLESQVYAVLGIEPRASWILGKYQLSDFLSLSVFFVILILVGVRWHSIALFYFYGALVSVELLKMCF